MSSLLRRLQRSIAGSLAAMDAAPRRTLLGVLGTLTAIALAMPVFHQEAYYWLYSEHLALSYFDHPPMVAWLIWLGTLAFGNSNIGLRLGTLLAALLAMRSGLGILREFEFSRRSQTLWVLSFLFVPIFGFLSFHASPDMPLCAATLFSVWMLIKARRSGALHWWLLAGVGAGCALLSKYSAAFLGLGGVLVLLFDPVMRRRLLSVGPWLALIVAIAVFSPVLIWNAQHDWVSIRFQTEDRVEGGHFGLHWFGQFLGLQLVALNPVIAIFLVLGALYGWRKVRGGDYRFGWLLAFSLPMIVVMGGFSFWAQVKINWLISAYPYLVFALLHRWEERDVSAREASALRWRRWQRVGFAMLWLSPALLLLGPLLNYLPFPPNARWNDWESIALRADEIEDASHDAYPDQPEPFFFTDHYSDAALLAYHLVTADELEEHKIKFGHLSETPEYDEPVFAGNVLGKGAIGFDYWTPPIEFLGHDAVFVVTRPDRAADVLEHVRLHFETVTLEDDRRYYRFGIENRHVQIFLCRNYRGPSDAAHKSPSLSTHQP